MSNLIDNAMCPKCKSKRTMNHCKSPTCLWFICKPCTTKMHDRVFVFDSKNRTMKGNAV